LNNRGDRAYTYIDHAYCITSHKSQGSTYDKCIAVYDVSNHKTNFNEFYVAATRQREDVSICTNSKEKFKEQAQEEQDKISTLDPVFRKFEGRLLENREEVNRETKEKLQSFKAVDILEEKRPEQAEQRKREPPPWLQEKKPEKPKEKERDYGKDL
jgi:ATP-dependent exoDNAse (exonuclease V) beta subunit